MARGRCLVPRFGGHGSPRPPMTPLRLVEKKLDLKKDSGTIWVVADRALRLSISAGFARMKGFIGGGTGRLPQSNQGVDSVEIKISARHGSLSEATQAKVIAKVEKLTRLFERVTAIEVTVNLEHPDAPIVDVKISAEHRHDFVATAQAEDLLAATDGVIHKLEHQLRKHKDKIQDRHRGVGSRQAEVPDRSEETTL